MTFHAWKMLRLNTQTCKYECQTLVGQTGGNAKIGHYERTGWKRQTEPQKMHTNRDTYRQIPWEASWSSCCCNVCEALYVRKTFAVKPSISCWRCLLRIAVYMTHTHRNVDIHMKTERNTDHELYKTQVL